MTVAHAGRLLLGARGHQTLAWRNILETEYTVSDPAAIANATLEEFLWAVSMVMSRGYGSHEPSSKEGDLVEVEGSLKGPLVLIPLADLVNHWTWEARTWKRFPPDPVSVPALLPQFPWLSHGITRCFSGELKSTSTGGCKLTCFSVPWLLFLGDAGKWPHASLPFAKGFCRLHFGRFCLWQKVATAHQEGGGFVFRATASIRKGEEIRACYGHFPNNELALVYGFVLDDNVDDGVTLADGADETVAWFQKILLEVCSQTSQICNYHSSTNELHAWSSSQACLG